jgi:hypothetical protein
MLLSAVNQGLGNSAGAVIAGKMQASIGTVDTFLYAASVDLFLAMLVTLYLSARSNSFPRILLSSLMGGKKIAKQKLN